MNALVFKPPREETGGKTRRERKRDYVARASRKGIIAREEQEEHTGGDGVRISETRLEARRRVGEGRKKHARRRVEAGGSRVEEERTKRREMKVGVLSR